MLSDRLGHRQGVQALITLAALTSSVVALLPAAAGTQLYNYDALGRVTRTCSRFNYSGELTTYVLDGRDNRLAYINQKTDGMLYPGMGFSSADSRFTLIFQNDGNLVLYQNSNSQALWPSGTSGSGATSAYFQPDGNFVLYGPSGAVWASGTSAFACAHLAVQTDGNVVIYTPDNQPVWNTGTGGH